MLEALGQFEDALTDYRAVLEVQPKDPAAWNNLGNASAGLARWRDAANFYGKAASLAPEFAFSAANKAVVMFQLGETDESMREMRWGMLTRAFVAGSFCTLLMSSHTFRHVHMLAQHHGASS